MGSELRVLVADDNPDILKLLSELLEAERCQVALCQDGASALARISREPFHLILCDIVMPGASGLEVLDKSNAIGAGIPLVLISGHVDAESAIFALRHGAFDYLPKPFRPEDIRDLVRRVRRLHGLPEEGAGKQVAPWEGVQSDRPHQEVLVKKSQALSLIARSGRVLTETHELGRLMGVILELAMRGVGAGLGAFLVSSESGDRLRVATSKGFSGALAAGDEVENVQELFALAGRPTKTASLAIPLAVRGQQVGAIVLADGQGLERFSNADREVLAILAQQASLALESASLYENIETTIFEGMRSLVAALEAKDSYTEGHSLRVAQAAVRICQGMGFPTDVETVVRYAGTLHDIGKVGIPDAILKKPGKLTVEEYERMKEHSIVGWNILMPFSFLREEAVIVRHHHEWMNGGGYPDGLRGGETPVAARILAVADAYDAMTTIRPYRGARNHEAAIEELRRCAGPQFDPEVVEVFASLPALDACYPDASSSPTTTSVR